MSCLQQSCIFRAFFSDLRGNFRKFSVMGEMLVLEKHKHIAQQANSLIFGTFLIKTNFTAFSSAEIRVICNMFQNSVNYLTVRFKTILKLVIVCLNEQKIEFLSILGRVKVGKQLELQSESQKCFCPTFVRSFLNKKKQTNSCSLSLHLNTAMIRSGIPPYQH